MSALPPSASRTCRVTSGERASMVASAPRAEARWRLARFGSVLTTVPAPCAGTIGLLTLAVLRAHGAGTVVSTDPNLAKRQRASALGADATIDARSPDVPGQVREALGGSADVVFDCVSVQSSLDQAIAIADKGGTVMVVGVPAREVTVPLPIVQDHQIRIQGSATYLPPDFAESADLLRRGAVRAADFVTAVRPLAQVAEAFELASSGQHVKVLVSADSPERLTDVHV